MANLKKIKYPLLIVGLFLVIVFGTASTTSAQQFVNDTNNVLSGTSYPLNSLNDNVVELDFTSGDLHTGPVIAYIKNIYIRFSKPCNATYKNLKISMALVGPGGAPASTTFTGNLKTVYGPLNTTIDCDEGVWHKIPLRLPFKYDSDNILVVNMEQDGITGYGSELGYFSGTKLDRYSIYGKSGKANGEGYSKNEYDFGFDTVNNVNLNDAGILGLNGLEHICASAVPQYVDVRLSNYGTVVLKSVYMGWSLDGVLQTPQYFSPGPDIGGFSDYGLTSLVFSKGVYHNLKVWTYLPNGVTDTVPENDTLTVNNLGPDTIPPSIRLLTNPFDSLQVAYPGFSSDYVDQDNPWITDGPGGQISLARSGSFYDTFPNGKNVNKVGVFQIIYTASDQCGNTASTTKQITVYDHVPPVISVAGNPIASVCRWAEYHDAGCTVSDNYYGLKDIRIDTIGTYITDGRTTNPGVYYLRFQATDKSGNKAISPNHRTIFVIPADSFGCKGGIYLPTDLQNNISIYPNPAEGLFTIRANVLEPKNLQISVLDILGKEQPLSGNKFFIGNLTQVDLMGKPAGLYFIKLMYGNSLASFPVVVRR